MDVVKNLIKAMKNQGMSSKQICRKLNSKSVPAPFNKEEWTYVVLEKYEKLSDTVKKSNSEAAKLLKEYESSIEIKIQKTYKQHKNIKSYSKNNCLIVLHPREIPECVKSISELPIDKLYMKAFKECDLCDPINKFIQDTNYDNYLILSDDVIVSPESLHLVENLLEKYESATGYCLMARECNYANVTRSPLRCSSGSYPVLSDYDFYDIREIKKFQHPEFLTWFGGWCLTGFSRDIWLKYPFQVVSTTGSQSDYAMCIKYKKHLVCHRDAYVDHLREEIEGTCYTNFIVGKKIPEMIHEKCRRKNSKDLHCNSNMEEKMAVPTSVKLLPFI